MAKEVCEKVIDHRHEGQINNSLNAAGGATGTMSSQNAAGSLANNDATITADYNIQLEINSLCDEANLQRAKDSVINMEKMLIQKKLKLDQVGDAELQKLIQFFSRVLGAHQSYLTSYAAGGARAAEDESNSQLRRIIIKSLLVVLNFVYSKKYLKDIIAGYSQPVGVENKQSRTEILGGKKQASSSTHCPMEDEDTLNIFKETLFGVIREAQPLGGAAGG